MSNEAMGLDDSQSPKSQKDEDGDGLQTPNYAGKESFFDVLSHGQNPSSKKARLEGPGDVSFKSGLADLSDTKEMLVVHVQDLHRAQNDDLSINLEVQGNVNAEIGKSAEKPDLSSYPSLSKTPTHVQPSVESVQFQSASLKPASLAISGEHQYMSISSIATSGTCGNSDADDTLCKQGSEFTDPSHDHLDGRAAHESCKKDLHALYNNNSEVLYNGSMFGGMSQEHTLQGTVACVEIPESYGSSGWRASQTGPNTAHMADTHVGRPPYEAIPENGSCGRYTQERAFPHFPFLDSSASVGAKGEPAQFACKDTFEICNSRGSMRNHRSSNNDAATYLHEKSSAYNRPGGEDLKVNIEHTTFSNQAPSSTGKDGSVFSGTLYYASQSGYMKNWALMLRFGSAIFSLVAFSVIISTSEKRVAAGSTFYVKFSDFQAYNYAAALNLLTFLYSSGQLIMLAQARTSRILSSPLKGGASVYLCDQMLAFLMVSSSSSAATASELSRHGLHNIWPPACSTWRLSLFCSRADVAVALSFVSCLFMFLSTFASGHHLANLLAE